MKDFLVGIGEDTAMRTAYFVLFILLAFTVTPVSTATARDGETELTPEQIIKAFSEKETEFFNAWKRYTYTQTAIIRVLSVDGVPKKNQALRLVYNVVFDDAGERKIDKLEETGRLEDVIKTPEDEQVILNLLPFALTSEDLSSYDLKYRGKERVDELDCYVFSVKPKNTKGGKIYFEGKIWVDDVDLQIVRTVGRVVPEIKGNQFPEFETLRQVVDGKYWFPAWTHAQDTLHFRNQGPVSFQQQDVEVEETITYEGYKEFITESKIRFGKQVPSDDDTE